MRLPSVNRSWDVSFFRAEVVEWQTRTFEGRVAKAVRVQVPPSAPNSRQLQADFQQTLPGAIWI